MVHFFSCTASHTVYFQTAIRHQRHCKTTPHHGTSHHCLLHPAPSTQVNPHHHKPFYQPRNAVRIICFLTHVAPLAQRFQRVTHPAPLTEAPGPVPTNRQTSILAARPWLIFRVASRSSQHLHSYTRTFLPFHITLLNSPLNVLPASHDLFDRIETAEYCVSPPAIFTVADSIHTSTRLPHRVNTPTLWHSTARHPHTCIAPSGPSHFLLLAFSWFSTHTHCTVEVSPDIASLHPHRTVVLMGLFS